jgi:hypothetical protein
MPQVSMLRCRAVAHTCISEVVPLSQGSHKRYQEKITTIGLKLSGYVFGSSDDAAPRFRWLAGRFPQCRSLVDN